MNKEQLDARRYEYEARLFDKYSVMETEDLVKLYEKPRHPEGSIAGHTFRKNVMFDILEERGFFSQ